MAKTQHDIHSICYWCGQPATTREHVPPRGLFPKGYREELIRVGACNTHNTDFSRLDERFKIYIQTVSASQLAVDDFKSKTVKGLNRPEAAGLVKSLSDSSFYHEINGEKRIVMKIDTENTEKFVEKIVRGLYFYHTGKHILGENRIISCSIQFYNPDTNYEEFFKIMLPVLQSNIMTEGDNENPDIFRYRFYYLDLFDAFIIALNFYKSVEFVAMVLPETIPNDLPPLDNNPIDINTL